MRHPLLHRHHTTVGHTTSRAAAHQLTTGDEIVWRDGTTTTVVTTRDNPTTGHTWLALSNGRQQTVRRGRQFSVVTRQAQPA